MSAATLALNVVTSRVGLPMAAGVTLWVGLLLREGGTRLGTHKPLSLWTHLFFLMIGF